MWHCFNLCVCLSSYILEGATQPCAPSCLPGCSRYKMRLLDDKGDHVGGLTNSHQGCQSASSLCCWAACRHAACCLPDCWRPEPPGQYVCTTFLKAIMIERQKRQVVLSRSPLFFSRRYTLSYPPEATVEDKVLLLSANFLLDFLVFQ